MRNLFILLTSLYVQSLYAQKHLYVFLFRGKWGGWFYILPTVMTD